MHLCSGLSSHPSDPVSKSFPSSLLLSYHIHTYTYIPHMRGNIIFIFLFFYFITLSCSFLFSPCRYHLYSGLGMNLSSFKSQAVWKLVQVWWLGHDAHVWFKPRFLFVKLRVFSSSQEQYNQPIRELDSRWALRPCWPGPRSWHSPVCSIVQWAVSSQIVSPLQFSPGL